MMPRSDFRGLFLPLLYILLASLPQWDASMSCSTRYPGKSQTSRAGSIRPFAEFVEHDVLFARLSSDKRSEIWNNR